MGELLLDSLEVRNFRAFRHLTIEALGRVNLIVGNNNVGKTCLLEALWLYASRGDPDVQGKILLSRDESNTLQNLTYERGKLSELVQIGSMKALNQGAVSDNSFLDVIPDALLEMNARVMVAAPTIAGICYFITASGLDAIQIINLWDAIAFSRFEDTIVTALRIIEPRVERLGINVEYRNNGTIRRIPVIRFAGNDYPVSLRSMGEGMVRLFGIALALVNARDGMLLIDEIENGLHYSIQPDVWRIIFEIAQQLNIQVFTTTHSKDCLAAFQQVSQEHPEAGMLIRLGRRKGEIVSTLFDEEELEIAIEQDVEVR